MLVIAYFLATLAMNTLKCFISARLMTSKTSDSVDGQNSASVDITYAISETNRFLDSKLQCLTAKGSIHKLYSSPEN